MKEINKLDVSKVNQQYEDYTKIIRKIWILCTGHLYYHDNYISVFPAALKLAVLAPVFNKGSKTSKENFKPVSIQLNVSKNIWVYLIQQICSCFDNNFSKYQCDFNRVLAPITVEFLWLENGEIKHR